MSFPSLGEVGARAGASLQSLATAASAAAEAQVAGLGAQLTSRLQAALKLGQSTRLLQIETALPSASLVVPTRQTVATTSCNGPSNTSSARSRSQR